MTRQGVTDRQGRAGAPGGSAHSHPRCRRSHSNPVLSVQWNSTEPPLLPCALRSGNSGGQVPISEAEGEREAVTCRRDCRRDSGRALTLPRWRPHSDQQ